MTPTEFTAQFPEFAPTHEQYPTLIASTLAIVELQVSELWGDERDEIVGLECAARLAAAPQGRVAQLIAKDGSSTYSRILNERKAAQACCLLRVG